MSETGELGQLRARIEHLENVIAVAASVLTREPLSREDRKALLRMLREAFHRPPAEPREEPADAERQTKGLEALVAAARVVTASGGGSVVMVRLREALAGLDGMATREPDAHQDHA